MALTIFAFNNTPQQYAIREAGGIKYSVFEPFLNSSIEYDVCYAAFQVTNFRGIKKYIPGPLIKLLYVHNTSHFLD